MTWSKWTYTIPTGATTAFAGQVIASATWNSIFSDLQTALNALPQSYILTGVNFNSVGDNLITVALPAGFNRYGIVNLYISGASGSLSSAKVGLFTTLSGAGFAIVASSTAVTITTGSEATSNNLQNFTILSQSIQSYNMSTLYFRVSTAEGSAATANVTLTIVPLS